MILIRHNEALVVVVLAIFIAVTVVVAGAVAGVIVLYLEYILLAWVQYVLRSFFCCVNRLSCQAGSQAGLFAVAEVLFARSNQGGRRRLRLRSGLGV